MRATTYFLHISPNKNKRSSEHVEPDQRSHF